MSDIFPCALAYHGNEEDCLMGLVCVAEDNIGAI